MSLVSSLLPVFTLGIIPAWSLPPRHHGARLSAETLRRCPRSRGRLTRRRRVAPTLADARAYRGELMQLEGSHHDCLEGRGPRYVLMAYIDNASSRVFARFYDYESTWSALDSPINAYSTAQLPSSCPSPPADGAPWSNRRPRIRGIGLASSPGRGPRGHSMNRTFLFWQEADISRLVDVHAFALELPAKYR